MPVVTQQQYDLAVDMKRINQQYGVPLPELMDLATTYFEAGMAEGLTKFATMQINAVSE